MMILREKDLSEEEFRGLAVKVKDICERYDVPLSVNSFYKTAIGLGIKRVHLPLGILRDMNAEEKAEFDIIGTSCHSVEDALEAERLGAGYIIAGHIFETDCKKGLAGRGLAFLGDICCRTKLPVYAIGGICPKNAGRCISEGADGVCLMSSLMTAENVSEYMDSIRGEIDE